MQRAAFSHVFRVAVSLPHQRRPFFIALCGIQELPQPIMATDSAVMKLELQLESLKLENNKLRRTLTVSHHKRTVDIANKVAECDQ